MTQNRASTGIGERLGKYRRVAGLSAQELSDNLGGSLSRGVIANIESGRKTDVTIDQLIELSWALGVPPVALALPIEQPFSWVSVGDNQSRRVLEVMGWMNSIPEAFQRDRAAHQTEAGVVARNRIRVLREMAVLSRELDRAKLLAAGDPDRFGETLSERSAEYDRAVDEAIALGIDFSNYLPDGSIAVSRGEVAADVKRSEAS